MLGELLRNTLSTAGEFHDQLREFLSRTDSKERSVPRRTEGERIMEMLWRLQLLKPWSYRASTPLGVSQLCSRGEFQETYRVRGMG